MSDDLHADAKNHILRALHTVTNRLVVENAEHHVHKSDYNQEEAEEIYPLDHELVVFVLRCLGRELEQEVSSEPALD